MSYTIDKDDMKEIFRIMDTVVIQNKQFDTTVLCQHDVDLLEQFLIDYDESHFDS